jgi:cytoplasmic iron level regulating protein YaaA (DUF328/UPF0246 family)
VIIGQKGKRKGKNVNKFWREKMREKIKEERDSDKVTYLSRKKVRESLRKRIL